MYSVSIYIIHVNICLVDRVQRNGLVMSPAKVHRSKCMVLYFECHFMWHVHSSKVQLCHTPLHLLNIQPCSVCTYFSFVTRHSELGLTEISALGHIYKKYYYWEAKLLQNNLGLALCWRHKISWHFRSIVVIAISRGLWRNVMDCHELWLV